MAVPEMRMLMMQSLQRLQATFNEKTINELTHLVSHHQLNLEPGFQRKSVWTLSDRRRLVQSIVSNYPLPSIFLYERSGRTGPVYDVLDGKQRLESIFMFMGLGRFRRGHYYVRLDIGEGLDWVGWEDLKRRPEMLHQFATYKIPVTVVTGELGNIVDLFVRINSTGKPLTSGEKRHARFFNSRFLREAEWLVTKFRGYLLRERILSEGQLERMKGTELFSELLMSLSQGSIINKKTALDRAIGNETINANTLGRLSREVVATINTIKKMFPELGATRFHNSAEFYSLFLLVWEMRDKGFILNDRKRNQIAQRMLRRLSTGVDDLRERLRRAKPARNKERLYADYLLTVQGDTDSAANRTRRREVLYGLLAPLFDFKDDQRAFTVEQRRILWNSDEKRLCPACQKPLTWSTVSVDHILAHTRGGKSDLANARLMHTRCNSRKGAR